MNDQGISSIWPTGTPLIGMIHLMPLPGSPTWGGSMNEVVDRAVRDARLLAQAGFDGLMVENYADVPFFRGSVPPETVAAISAAVLPVQRESRLPVGVNVLRNDARAALGIATATGARFVRVNVHTGSMWTDQGLIEGDAANTLRTRAATGADVAILADVHVKHASPPAGSSIEDAAADTWHRGRADGLIVSGSGTGSPTARTDVERVRASVPGAPVLIGSGATLENIGESLEIADGVIVGSAVMRDGRAGTGVDEGCARAFVEAARP